MKYIDLFFSRCSPNHFYDNIHCVFDKLELAFLLLGIFFVLAVVLQTLWFKLKERGEEK